MILPYRCSSWARNYSARPASVLPCGKTAVVELLPLRPTRLDASLSRAYQSAYEEEFNRPFMYAENAIAWGLGDRASKVGFSGGAGYYTLKYARHFKTVLHCDPSSASLSYVHRKATVLGLSIIYLPRIDY